VFLLASISKPISAAAVMTLYDNGKFDLDDPARKFLPDFTGDDREKITMRPLLTHVSGLPDQLPENSKLRASHAPLSEFVEAASCGSCGGGHEAPRHGVPQKPASVDHARHWRSLGIDSSWRGFGERCRTV
jgi:CubicO group peptidase (beta-lactamase class C family)